METKQGFSENSCVERTNAGLYIGKDITALAIASTTSPVYNLERDNTQTFNQEKKITFLGNNTSQLFQPGLMCIQSLPNIIVRTSNLT